MRSRPCAQLSKARSRNSHMNFPGLRAVDGWRPETDGVPASNVFCDLAANRDEVRLLVFDHYLASRNPGNPLKEAQVAPDFLFAVDSESVNCGAGGIRHLNHLAGRSV